MDIQSEVVSRQQNATVAHQLLKEGDVAYNTKKYEEAAQKFAEALVLAPSGQYSKALRTELGDRYATAAAQVSKQYRVVGKYDEAREMLARALEFSPDNTFAQEELSYLNDPIRTNPSLTPKHTQNVDQVRRLLYKGEGHYNLGEYDKAEEVFNDVLEIDNFNKSARRWLERVSAIRSDYDKAAYDHTRAKLLSEVSEGWELQPQASDQEVQELIALGSIGFNTPEIQSLESKLKDIVIPKVDFIDVNIYEALDELRQLTIANDSKSLPEELRGIQFIAQFPDRADAESRRFNLNLSNVPVDTVIKSISNLLGISYVNDGYTITLSSDGSSGGALFVRSYSVSPDFLDQSPGSGVAAASNDPFAESPEDDNSLRGAKIDAFTVLKNYGIKFENGATASFLPSSGKLIVKNTASEHLLISDLVESLAQKEPMNVAVELGLMRISQLNDEQIASDVNLTGLIASALGDGEAFIAGGSSGNPNITTGDIRPLTAGNRSGAVNGFNTLDDLLLGNRNTGVNSRTVRDLVEVFSGEGDGIIESETVTAVESAQSRFPEAPGIISVLGGVDDATLEVLLRGLSQKTGHDFIQKPSFVTKSGQQAELYIGREFIYPTEYDPPTLIRNRGGSGLNNDLDDFEDDFGNLFTINSNFYLVFDENINLIEVFFQGQTFSDDIAGGGLPAQPTSFETRETGTDIKVIPTVDENNSIINLAINAEYVEFTGFINYGTPLTAVLTNVDLFDPSLLTPEFATLLIFDDGPTLIIVEADPANPGVFGPIIQTTELFNISDNLILVPLFDTISVNTNVSIYDGTTLVLGGNINSLPVQVEDKTPILGDIPIIGNLFQSEVEKTTKTHILMTVKANLIDSAGRPINNRGQ